MRQVLNEIQDATVGAAGSGAQPAVLQVGSPDVPAQVSPEERHRLIAAAAYRRYEQRGGAPGDPVNDWLEAEREVDLSLVQPSEALAERVATAKCAFSQWLATLVAEAQAQLETLAFKAAVANAVVRRKYEEQRAIAAAKLEVARGKLAQIGEHTDGAWGHLKEGAEKAAQEMNLAVRQLATLFSEGHG
jgi:hypothetical protein